MMCFVLVSMVAKITTYLLDSGRWITGSHASAFRKFEPFFRTQFVQWQKVAGAYKVEWRGGLSVLPWIFAIHWMLFQKIPYVNPFCSQATTITSDRTRPRKIVLLYRNGSNFKTFYGLMQAPKIALSPFFWLVSIVCDYQIMEVLIDIFKASC